MNILILIALALAPVVAIGMYIYTKDQYQREPVKMVILAFVLGIVSTWLVLLISPVIESIFPTDHSSYSGLAIFAFIEVAFVEELSKLAVIMLFLFRNKEFNEPFDGIVYASLVGLGFAGFENVLYVLGEPDFSSGLSIALARMFTAVPAHASFGVVMGFYLGKAKFEGKGTLKYILLGLFGALVLHGAYDFCLMTGEASMIIGALVSLGLSLRLAAKAIKFHDHLARVSKVK